LVNKIYVLDTSAVIAGFVPGLTDAEQVTIQEVLEEARDLCSRLEFETAVSAGKVSVVEPSKESVLKVRDKVGQTGDRVSEVDIKLLATALDLQLAGKAPELITDDYAIQNLASFFGISYNRVAMPGITEVFSWVMVCPACGRTYPPNTSQCEICGTQLRRKPKK
jgi:UPF0271 protein